MRKSRLLKTLTWRQRTNFRIALLWYLVDVKPKMLSFQDGFSPDLVLDDFYLGWTRLLCYRFAYILGKVGKWKLQSCPFDLKIYLVQFNYPYFQKKQVPQDGFEYETFIYQYLESMEPQCQGYPQTITGFQNGKIGSKTCSEPTLELSVWAQTLRTWSTHYYCNLAKYEQ